MSFVIKVVEEDVSEQCAGGCGDDFLWPAGEPCLFLEGTDDKVCFKCAGSAASTLIALLNLAEYAKLFCVQSQYALVVREIGPGEEIGF